MDIRIVMSWFVHDLQVVSLSYNSAEGFGKGKRMGKEGRGGGKGKDGGEGKERGEGEGKNWKGDGGKEN